MSRMNDSVRYKFDLFLLLTLFVALVGHYSRVTPVFIDTKLLFALSGVALFPIVISAITSLREKRISVDLLASVALLTSLVTGEWAAAAFINLMLTSARIFDHYTERRTASAVQKLLKLRPQVARIERGGTAVEVPVAEIKVGDTVYVELGGRVPVDGKITNGTALIDQSTLTGESLPVEKKRGDSVFASTLVTGGSVTMRADSVGLDTFFEKIIALVQNAQRQKIKIQTIADRFATWYILGSVIVAVAIFVFTRDIRLVLSVLLVVCADDIAVAIPLAFSAALARAAQLGVIIKGGDFIEVLANTSEVFFDKTGTITKGELTVAKIFPAQGFSDADVLSYAAMAEFFSTHPFAKAIISYARTHAVAFERPEEFSEIAGNGSSVVFRDVKISIGKPTYLTQEGVTLPKDGFAFGKNNDSMVSTIVYIGYGNEFAGSIVLRDAIRTESPSVVRALVDLGIKRSVMLTGDTDTIARDIAQETGISEVHANLLPEDKVEFIRSARRPGTKIAMVGDGVNDAAALALADVSIAMGAAGSDVAVHAADVALMENSLRGVPLAIRLGRFVVHLAKQNFLICGVVNIFGLVLVFTRVLDPAGAAAFNFVTDFLPIANALRVLRWK